MPSWFCNGCHEKVSDRMDPGTWYCSDCADRLKQAERILYKMKRILLEIRNFEVRDGD